MRFHQVLVSASAGDAITNMAFELHSLLSAFGTSTIHALNIDPRLGDSVQKLDAITRKHSQSASDDVIIFHASIGEPRVTQFVAQRPERLVISYHNISPPEPFLAFEPAFAGLLASGRIEVASLAVRTELAITESQYNAKELIDMGFDNVHVVPMIVDTDAMLAIPPNPGTMNHFDKAVTGPVVLFVGQLLPHKRPDLLIESFHVLATHLIPEANLIMVGAPRFPTYRDHLDELIRELNLPKVSLFGSVTQQELVAIYRNADAFITLSEHEGYCVPLIEAMGFDVPIVARDCAAVSETLDGAGILLPGKADPLLAAEAMHEVLTNEALSKAMVKRGRKRLATLDPDVSRAATLNLILGVAER